MFAPARKGRISCAVKSNAKNLRGLGKERRLIFLWLVLFSRRGTGYEILTSSVSLCLHHRESLALSRTLPSRIMFRS